MWHIKVLSTALALVMALATLTAEAAPSRGGRIPSALIISKSSNRNEVHYTVEVDETCMPAGPQPVAPYWLMLERGPTVTETLSERELRYLGVAHQDVTPKGIDMTLRVLPRRVLTLHTWQTTSGQCTSSVDMTIAGAPAHLVSVFAQQSLFGVSYVLLTGIAADGMLVRERVEV
jgi:Domain of unknown function (DUF4833)